MGAQGLFIDRRDAGAKLAQALERYRGQDVLVLGIPRGGVVVAAEVARQLDADLDVVVARKLGAPAYPELALGAVTADGARFLNEEILRELRVTESYLEGAIALETAAARRREDRIRGPHHMGRVKDRVVVVVDDGVATGATMRAAIRSVRRKHPAKLVVAVPVGARATCAALRAEADEVVCLHEPESFFAVGSYYRHFETTSDDEVDRLMGAEYVNRGSARKRAG